MLGGWERVREMRDLQRCFCGLPYGLSMFFFSLLGDHGFEILSCGLKTKAEGYVLTLYLNGFQDSFFVLA